MDAEFLERGAMPGGDRLTGSGEQFSICPGSHESPVESYRDRAFTKPVADDARECHRDNAGNRVLTA